MKKVLDKIKKFNYKKNKPIIYLVLLILLVGIGGTIAFQMFTGEFTNEFKTSAYNVEIEEEFYSKWGAKKVSFINNDGTAVVIRVNYTESWEDSNGYALNNKVNKIDVVNKMWTEEWLNDFILGQDGWYYYNKILSTGNRVRVLSEITLNEDLIKDTFDYNKYLTSDYELDFNYEAVQADKKAIKELWGHDVTITDNEIEWSFN